MSAVLSCPAACVSVVMNKAEMYSNNIKHIKSQPFCALQLYRANATWLHHRELKLDA